MLLVDDDPSVGAFVTAALAGTADVVVVARDAEHGLALVGTEDVDGVVVDNGLPDLSGVEFVRLLRADPRTLSLPIVLFTGSASPDVERQARLAGADDFLSKPVEPLLLEERVLRAAVAADPHPADGCGLEPQQRPRSQRRPARRAGTARAAGPGPRRRRARRPARRARAVRPSANACTTTSAASRATGSSAAARRTASRASSAGGTVQPASLSR